MKGRTFLKRFYFNFQFKINFSLIKNTFTIYSFLLHSKSKILVVIKHALIQEMRERE